MRASAIERRDGRQQCELRARIESDALPEPFELWLRVRADLAHALDPANGDFLVPALLLPAMKAGEPLEIPAAISPVLARATRRIQAIFESWEPRLSRVPVSAPERAEARPAGDEIGLFYSAGVDSSYSLTKNAIDHPLNEDVVTQLLIVHGLDVRVDDPRGDLFARMLANAERVGARLGRGVIPVVSNVQDLMACMGIPWGSLGHGSGLACVGLALAPIFRRLYIAPCSGSYRKLVPSGSHPLLDPLWSTESLDFVHDGCEATRLERIRLLAEHPLILDSLRVCWDRETPELNCGRCSKCLLLQVGLHATGALGKCPALPKTLDLEALRDVNLVIPAEVDWCAELIEALDSPSDAKLRDTLVDVHRRFSSYFERLERAARILRKLVPKREPFVLVDEEAIREKLGAGIPFLEKDGVFIGNPPDDSTAIRELERLRSAGAAWIAFWWADFWYLEHYREFARHLRSRYRCAWEDDSVIVFDLRGS